MDQAHSCPLKNQMAIVSAHDGTIINLMSSLGRDVWGDLEWPPYASMMIIEVSVGHRFAWKSVSQHRSTIVIAWKIHKIKRANHKIKRAHGASGVQQSFAFRLLYNGQVRTPKIVGCPLDAELCDIQVLWDTIKPFASRSRNCASKNKPLLQSKVVHHRYFAMFFALLVGACLGSVFVCQSTVVRGFILKPPTY
jgi:ubiquitin-like domain-containing CTD phosphatase 1